MNDEDRKWAVTHTLELIQGYDSEDIGFLSKAFDTLVSLKEAVEEAGGDSYGILCDYMSKDSNFLDFIANVAAPNGVRFHCNKKDFREEW